VSQRHPDDDPADCIQARPKRHSGQLRAASFRTIFPLMNRIEPAGRGGEARIRFLDGDYQILSPGAFVRCAVTGVAIPLDELKYWNVAHQEAYADPATCLARHKQLGLTWS
jgi:hypothetical protein